MNQNNPDRTYAALGLAGLAGFLAVIMAVGALLIGLLLDQVLGTHKILALVCVVASVPVNLIITLRVTQTLIRRIIPPDQSGTASAAAKNKPDKTAAEREDD